MRYRPALLAGYGWSRIAAGAALAAAPGAIAGRWLGPPAGDPAVRAAVRLLGVRDVLVGVATARAASTPAATAWALAGAAADAADLLVTVAARARLPRSARAVAVSAVGGTATGLFLAWLATRDPPARSGGDR